VNVRALITGIVFNFVRTSCPVAFAHKTPMAAVRELDFFFCRSTCNFAVGVLPCGFCAQVAHGTSAFNLVFSLRITC